MLHKCWIEFRKKRKLIEVMVRLFRRVQEAWTERKLAAIVLI